MQIDEEKAVFELQYCSLSVVYLRTAYLTVVVPHPVQIITRQTAPIAAIYYSIGVEHGHNLEDEALSQLLRLFRTRNEEVDEAFAHKRRRSFSWMHATGNEGHSLFSNALEIRNSNHFHVVSAW